MKTQTPHTRIAEFLPAWTAHAATVIVLAYSVLAISTLAGCQTQAEPDLPPMPSGKITTLPAVGPRTVGQMTVDQIYLPFNTRLEPLLAEVSTEGIAADQRAAWNANELQMFRLNAVELSQLYKAIDEGSSMRRNRHSITKHDLLLETTPRLERSIAIDWAAEPNLDQTLRMPAGRTRFLGKVAFDEGTATITLTPQHHWVKATLIPRTPLEKTRDGRIFDELTLSAELPANTFLVIFWHRSDDSDALPIDQGKPAEPEVEQPGATDPVDTTAAPANHGNLIDITPPPPSGDQPTEPASDPTVEPTTEPKEDSTAEPAKEVFKFELPPALPRLGRLLLTGRRANKPLQLVLVIHSPAQVDPANASRPAVGDDAKAPAQPQPQPDRESPNPSPLPSR